MRHISVIVATLLLAGCGKEQAAPPAVPPAPTFVVQAVKDVAIHPERSAPAAVVGKNEARISAEVAAVILALPVDVGQRVRKGAIVARLDSRDAALAQERADAALAQTQARHAQAAAQFKRAQMLREQNFYSAEALTLKETELTAATADLRAARAQRDTARRNVEKHTLAAPFDAVVRARSGQVGELAAPGAVLLTLVSAGEVELAAPLQAADAGSFTSAVPPAPTFQSNDVIYPLKLLRISPTVNRDSRSIEARFAFSENAPSAGTEGRLVWHEPAPWLPADLLVRRNGRYGIFIAVDGKARFHSLAAAQEGRPAALDLPPETQIVTQGRHALQDGVPLQ
ncbi:MAG: efflux RND transporter periplasmic adaptor subunit [Rhodocyclaceae bacterium]|nr:efflux RND transporter periplasmic adaptor subunit [Rhodocyclaceae bacterium]MDZ4215960.1 efflux RND transporter periplasmic adaptor subunit [Rhodocyclaceae bacterium]